MPATFAHEETARFQITGTKSGSKWASPLSAWNHADAMTQARKLGVTVTDCRLIESPTERELQRQACIRFAKGG